MHDIYSLLTALGNSKLGETAYDTAWIARLEEIDGNIANQALNWICEHQLSDGSWGTDYPLYYHDRVVCTLGAMIALTYRGKRTRDRNQIERGLIALEKITAGATQGLRSDPNGATVGFEMIVPTLISEAERLGIIKQQGDRILGKFKYQREAKMAKLSGLKISRKITAAHSAEMAGTDRPDLLDIENLQERNGAVGNSPASTAYFALYLKPGNELALNYLYKNIQDNGGAPTITPIEIFERIWVLWNLTIANIHTDPKVMELCLPHIDYIEENWRQGEGVGFSKNYTLTDGDDTSVGYEILHTFGREVDLLAVLSFEEAEWFRCFQLELAPSLDVNIHVMGALNKAGYEKDHPSIQKILNLLYNKRQPGNYWFDKWHVSPFYTTAHAIINCYHYDPEICRDAITWILDSQHSDGSWGMSGISTAEETAYCIQALSIWEKYGEKVPTGRIDIARNWLLQHCEPPYPPLWIDKSLYCPELLVQAAILSALALSEE
jgi:halimadienyl-diphosphate synthase